MELKVVNILDLIDVIGEDETKNILSVFICQKNPEIENFVRNSAVDFAKRKISITYLFVDENIDKVYAIYAITHKVIEIDPETLSKTKIKQIERFAEKDIESGKYIVSAFLLAQFGKSFDGKQANISGNAMMDTVIQKLKEVQHEIGGGIVYLECEDKAQLLDFYKNDNNHFVLFGERFDTMENVLYKQLLRVI